MTKGIMEYWPPHLTPRPQQLQILQQIERNWRNYDVFAVTAPVACHRVGQKVRLVSGQSVAIEALKVGDVLLGPDGKGREVLETHRGTTDNFYRVIPIRGSAFEVTADHIISVFRHVSGSRLGKDRPRRCYQEIVAGEWASKSRNVIRNSYLWRPNIPMPFTSISRVPVDPYAFGLWLGDGSSAGAAITTADEELAEYWEGYATSLGCDCRWDTNGSAAFTIHVTKQKGQSHRGYSSYLLEGLRSVGVLHNKHIPELYLRASVGVRREVLAGLIDTDGYVHGQTVVITQKSERLAQNILDLAQGLGLHANLRTVNKKCQTGAEGVYHNVNISGRLSDIPVRIPRKRGLDSVRDMNHVPFSVEKVPGGEWFGVKVSGDQLYLLEDYTVTHNCGKSAVAWTIAQWAGSTTICTPTNLLTQQYLDDFPDLGVLWRRNLYHCPTLGGYCKPPTGKRKLEICGGKCVYQEARDFALEQQALVVNYWTYMSNKLWRPTVIWDEAHNLCTLTRELAAKKMWHRDYQYPRGLNTVTDVIEWLESLPKLDDKCKDLLKQLTNEAPSKLVAYATEWNKTKYEPLIKLMPFTARDEAPRLWPHKNVRKMVLMSATIGEQDVKTLPLYNRLVKYIDVDSPIPAANRMIRYQPVGDLSYACQDRSVPALAEKIKYYLAYHTGQKGVIHCTYALARKLRAALTDPRLIWHTEGNTRAMYRQFLESPAKDGAVLVACGLSEGIDLEGDLGRWQVIAKVMYMSLNDPAVRYLCDHDSKRYQWEAAKKIVQASGRICRGPSDVGVTYICDTQFKKLYENHQDLFPLWFKLSVEGL